MDKLKKLEDILQALDRDTVTNEELAQVTGVLIDAIKKSNEKMEKGMSSGFQEFKDTLSELSKSIQSKSDSKTVLSKEEVQSLISEVKDLVTRRINAIELMPGDKGDSVQGEPGENGSPDTAEDIRNKLELLNGEDRLDAKYIKGIVAIDQKRIDDIEKMAKANSMPITTTFINGKRAKNFQFSGAVVTYQGDTAYISITGGGGGTWGSITGTLADQTDLQTALDGKMTNPMTTGGDVIYGGASGAPTRLANGTAGQVLQSNGTTLAPSWATLAGGGNALTSNPLSQFASTTSAQLAGVISDETGSGALVFGTSPNITTPTGIVKGDVGLGSVDNTTDAGKPVSTATQTALNLKANLVSPTFTGTVVLPSGQALIAPALGTPASGVMTNVTGTASGLTAGNVITNANLTGSITSVGNATSIADAALSIAKTSGLQTALDNRELLSNKSTNVALGSSDTLYPSQNAVKTYADSLVAGLLDYRGGYNASVNTFPASGGSGTAGAVLKGDMWIISVAGTLGGTAVQVGDSLIASVDTPGQTAGNWNVLNSNISYVPEDVANKVTSISGASTDTQYGSAKLLFDQLALKANLASPTFTGTVVLPNSQALVTPVLGTPTSVTLTNATGLPISGLVNSTSLALGVGSINLGHATDTTIARVSAGVIAVEGNNVLTANTGLPLAGGTMTGNITLAENASIALDPAGSADGIYTGITMTATSGYAQAFGDLVYLDSTNSRWQLADADAATTSDRMLAMVVVTGTNGNTCTLLLQGNIRADAKFPALTIGSAVYVGETAGAIQVAIPVGADNIIRRVGYALTADEIYFAPSMDSQITVA